MLGWNRIYVVLMEGFKCLERRRISALGGSNSKANTEPKHFPKRTERNKIFLAILSHPVLGSEQLQTEMEKLFLKEL